MGIDGLARKVLSFDVGEDGVMKRENRSEKW